MSAGTVAACGWPSDHRMLGRPRLEGGVDQGQKGQGTMAQNDTGAAKVRGRAAKRAPRPRQGEAEPDHPDTCRCDGCINVNYPRPRAVIHADLPWQVITGDCVDVMAELSSVDHVITDPPFEAQAHTKQRRVKRGSSIGPGDTRVAKIDSLSFEPLSFELRAKCGEEFARIAKRWAIVFCQVEATQLWSSAMGGMSYRRTGVWVKPDGMPQLTGDRPGMGYESIVFCHRKGRSVWNGGGRSSVFIHNKNSGGKHWHETQKPLPLMSELIDLFTSPGELVFDPFCGSGTTGIAALRVGRRFLGVEKNPEMADLARERIAADLACSTRSAGSWG